jgi:hypothetical protein
VERLAVALCCTAAAQHSMDQQLGHHQQPSTMLGFGDSSWSSPVLSLLSSSSLSITTKLYTNRLNPSSVLRNDPSGLTRAMFVQRLGQAFALLPHTPLLVPWVCAGCNTLSHCGLHSLSLVTRALITKQGRWSQLFGCVPTTPSPKGLFLWLVHSS